MNTLARKSRESIGYFRIYSSPLAEGMRESNAKWIPGSEGV